MSSQFTAQSLSDYLSAVSEKNNEDQTFEDSQKQISDEFKLRGQEMLGTAIIPTLHLIKGAYAKVNKLGEAAQNFKDKVETAGKQLQEAPEKLKTMVSNKIDEIGDSVVDKIKTTASNKLGGLVEEAKGQGAMLDTEPMEGLGSMLENSRLGNIYKRFKSATTTGEEKAQTLQQSAFEEDPEAGMQEMRPEPIQPESQAKIPQAPPEPEEGQGPVPEEGGEEMASMTDKVVPEAEDVGESLGETVGKIAGSELGDLALEGAASLIPGAGEVVDAGLLLYQGIEGLKDLFHKPEQEITEPTPTFQAGI